MLKSGIVAGGVAERSKAAVLKTVRRYKRLVGSNPTSSASFYPLAVCTLATSSIIELYTAM